MVGLSMSILRASGLNRSVQFVRRIFANSIMFEKSATNLSACPPEQVKEYLASIDTVLTDCDGVIWISDNMITGASRVFNRLREMGKRVFFVTNNSTRMRDALVVKAKKLGFIANQEDVLSTSYLTAQYLKDIGFNKKVYMIGSPALMNELKNVGIESIGVGPDVVDSLSKLLESKPMPDPEIGAVVVGFDEHFSYAKMLRAATYLSDPNCLFIATNTDERFPVADGYVQPGTGSIVRAVETAAERKAFVIGKPEQYICDNIMKNYGINPDKTLMIGDRCNTDILLGTRCGFKTLLVLTGVTKLSEVDVWKNGTQEERGLVPDIYLNGIGDLLPFLE